MNFLTIMMFYLIYFLDKSYNLTMVVLPLKLGYFWVIYPLLCCVIYLYRYKKYKNNKVLNSFEFNRMMCFSTSGLAFFMFLLMTTAANLMLKSYIPCFFYFLILFLFCYQMNLKGNNTMKNALYGNEDYHNKFSEFIERFMKFSQVYGGPIVILVIVVRRFVGPKTENGLIEQVAGFFSPLLMFIAFAFIIMMKEEVMQGYYLKKYCEEYRIKYGYSIEEWYGPKSKRYKEAMKNGEEI